MEDIATVRSRGIARLIECSKKYKDNKYRELINRDSIQVHDRCRKQYSRERVCYEALRDRKTRGANSDELFDFKQNCVICGEDASEAFLKKQIKKPKAVRDSVHYVETLPFKNSLISAAQQRNDNVVLDRLYLVSDLVAAEARYHKSCSKKYFARVSSSRPQGRPEDDDITNCFDYICNYLEENENECQFTLPEILKDFKGYIPTFKTLKARLIKKYGDEIIVTDEKNQNQVICFRNTGYKILTNSWYDSKKSNPQEERLRVIEAAAAIIREDIRSMIYPLDTYPKLDSFLEDVEKDVPESLKLLVRKIVTPKKCKNIEEVNTKAMAISHAVISTTRPRSFLSTIHIGLGALLYKKYGSKDLLDVLSSLAYCCSYYDARLFEASCIQHPLKNVLTNSFSQFVFDNADVNVDTIDGSNTFHAMGGIQCITPHSSVRSETRIPKLPKIPSAEASADLGTIPLVTFQKTTNALKKIPIYDINQRNPTETVNIMPTDFLWMYGKWKGRTDIPGWNGFMENLTSDEPFNRSRVLYLPFVNSPPGKHDTIYSVLLSAVEKIKAAGQKSCFVTFDQPLYIKARDIVASSGPGSPIGSVIVRLGGFHMLMSFIGAIGYIMDGSGLQDLFSVAYAAASTEKMLTGHVYSRAVRGHILAHLALAKCVLSMMDITDDENINILEVLDNIGKPTVDFEAPAIGSVMEKFTDKLLELEQNGPTAKLWVEYFRMVTILKRFIHAERSGDWNGHLQSVQQMLPYLHASGHFLYAKSCQLYLQDMVDLKSTLTHEDYDRFVLKGFFTVRRSEKFWSGIWSDMTIEQTLMRSMKTVGGVSRGRGITDSVLVKWISSMPAIVEVSLQIEQFCGVTFVTTEQHVDARLSRIRRDDSDVLKFVDWFSSHDPFPIGESIMSISTGVIGDEKINCHQAYEIGMESIANIIGSNFKEIKFKRKNRVTPLKCTYSKVRIHDEDVPVNPDTIFRRISFFKKSDKDLKTYFEFELAPYPLSIFEERGMRKTRKSVFYELFDPLTNENEEAYLNNPVYVIDGGFLLHRVVWQSKETFTGILSKYVDYVKKYYNKLGTTIVFDGYPDDASMKSTKTAERLRRKTKLSAANVAFDETMTATMSKEHFLSNDNNKRRLISMLRGKLESEGFLVKVAVEDADRLIVTTAIDIAQTSESVVIVGEDTDLIILLTALAPSSPHIVLMRPGKGASKNTLYSPNKFKFSDAAKNNILFLHAFSGCDTTSAFFRQVKMKFVNTLEKSKYLQDAVEIFKDDCVTADEIDTVGQKFLEAIYGDKRTQTSLDSIRYDRFTKTITKTNINLASLPPTQAAARQHSLRTYHQVQMWLGRDNDPLKWGWKTTKDGLLPVTTSKEPAPPEVLKNVSCKCEKGCRGGCSCRKAGMKCSYICFECKGQSCTNTPDDEISTTFNNEADVEFLAEDLDEPGNTFTIPPPRFHILTFIT